MRKKLKASAKFLAATAMVVLIGGLAAAWLVPLPARLYAPGSRMVEYDDGTPMCVFLSPDDKWRIPISLDEVDPDFIEALIQFEDERFRYHPGVDPISITRATLQNLKARRVVSGASTISMQLVRILEPRPRTLRSKMIEALRALQLELFLSKDEVLGYYLQFAPYGKNIEGLEAAALAFFGHRSRELSPYEITYLLGVPQRPTQRYPTPEHARQMPEVTERVTARLVRTGVFDEQEAASARRGVAPESIRSFPRETMHVSQLLIERHPQARVRSTISREAQTVVENTLTGYRSELRSLGIANATVVVVEVESGRVLAAAGSIDFWDDETSGQVTGFLAPRSPGSAMKPFIYALAIDQGLALPDYLTPDVPVRYDGYEPINYDREYRGLIRFDEALSQSLNIPFVNLLAEQGLSDYLAFLRAGGLTTLSGEPGHYGLSISIGAMEARPAELTNLYAMLARGGEYRDLAWTMDEEPSRPTRLLSPGASYLTRSALRRRDRPDFPRRSRAVKVPSDVFWKTGTSSRHRDAWALGGSAGVVAGVWVGNFDGSGNRNLVGAERAGPILFDVLEGIAGGSRGSVVDRPPSDLIEVEICAWSGHLAGPHCPKTKVTQAPVTGVPRKHCPYHVQYMVDQDTGLRVNPLCSSGREVEGRAYLIMPAAIRRWIDDQTLESATPPPFHPDCKQIAGGASPRIAYPRTDSVFFLVPGLKPTDQEIKLEANAGAETGELFWFVDGRFIAGAASHERVWLTPTPGEHEVRVLDESGRGHAVKIKIMPPG